MKEWIAVILLAAIFLGGMWNLHHLEDMTDTLLNMTEAAMQTASAGNWSTAAAWSAKIDQYWANADSYTHIFIRHPEIDGVTDAICSLQGAVAGRDYGEMTAAGLTLKKHLTSILGMEQLSFGSIF